ncbi:Uncharacterised protein [Candidatus Bartonella washoeensis]|uniref:Plasmid replication protein RepL domain-containing protein n=1 Tax=Candidatus Bartonella washoeensis Sb944nv TaxID=1094563 RepID=J0Q422_9HYPH|nr:hypothetical protein [Bartonella washoeensis]EJF79861.1 hypothetical protein MCQ_00593 [Bartonella washoeensis Sb944nv]SPU26887.1 Uncharacterised protein [Bartonella washoeensis]
MTIHTLAKRRKQTVRYAKNPFEVQKPFGDERSSIQREAVKSAKTRYSANTKTDTTVYKDVEYKKFTKQLVSNIGLFYELGSPGVKVFRILAWIFKNKTIGQDPIPLDSFVLQDFLKNQKRPLSISSSTFSRGLVELEDAKIIAKYIRKGWYFINPNFLFDGKHVVFMTDITCKENE